MGAAVAVTMAAAATAAALLSLLWLDRYGAETLPPFVGAVAGAAGVTMAVGLLLAQLNPNPGEAPGGATADALHAGAGSAAVVLSAVLAVLALCPPTRFPGLIEPLVMGAAAGLGNGLATALGEAVQRPVAAVSRVLWLALAGAGCGVLVGWARGGGGRASRVAAALAAPVVGAGAAMAGWWASAHGEGELSAAMVGVALALLGLTVLAAVAAERRVIRSALAREVALGVLPEWVVPVVASLRQRAFGAWWMPRRERRVVALVLVRLAFRAWACLGVAGEAGRLRGLEVGRLRQRARELLRLRNGAAERPEEW